MKYLLYFLYVFAISSIRTEEIIEDEVGGMPREWIHDPPCGDPWPPMNADLHCGVHLTMEDTFICKAACREGFQYPKGDLVLRHYCNLTTLKWTPEFEFPDCVEICTPPCDNSGTCAEENNCICQPKFRGNRCEFSMSACDPHEALSASAEWLCNHTSHKSSCVLNCPQNTEYEFQPDNIYTCSLDGTWTPSVAPKCQPINIIQHDQHSLFPAPTVKVLQLPETGTCVTWNQLHYRTFDGAFYHFQGPCTYVLAKDCIDNSFSIHVKHDLFYQITIYIGSDPYTLALSDAAPIVTFNDNTFSIPTSIHGLMFEKVSDYVTISSSLGFRLKWNKNSIVLKVDSQLMNKTCGLCGKFDGTFANDFEMVDGTVTENIETFVNSWTMEDLLAEKCEQSAVVKQQCSDVDGDIMGKANSACEVLLDPKFSTCHALVVPGPYLETCKLDFCACATPDSRCICDSLSQYFQECIRRGGKIEGGWRSDELCPLMCPEGMTYEDCGSSCPKTCRNTLYDCEDDHCVDGCHCPSGTVLHNGRCIPKDNCPCIHKGKEYQNGERYEQDCNACDCHMGKWQCTNEKCEARCSSVGDPHFTTFDGTKYEYLATCPMYLVYHNNFTIIQETIPCSLIVGSTQAEGTLSSKYCTKSITLNYDNSKLILKHGTYPSFNDKEVLNMPFRENGISVDKASSLFTTVELPNELSLMWDGQNRIYIDAPSSLLGQTRGLCGTFNKNQKDDFTTPDGDLEADVSVFAARWQASDTCHKRSRRSERNSCHLNPQNIKDAEELCSLLKSESFSKCHGEVDPEASYKSCVLDLCSCQQELTECICPIFADYSSICSKKGIILDWIEGIDFCKLACESGKVYQECSNPCHSSCLTLSSMDHCKETCVQGCACPEGTTLNVDSTCIPISQCPCVYEGKEFAAESTSVQDGKICTCRNALWECRPATLKELANMDIMINDQFISCSLDRHEEFKSCVEKCPMTCKNMHLVQSCETKICKPGCSCVEGHVFDEELAKCVESSECGCQHANRRHLEGETIKKECNLCTCRSGTWVCSEKTCPEQCTAWGDSHYRTFDGLIYDFHGDCDYVLSKGMQNEDGFTVSLRNVPCRGTGLTCSKSFTLDLAVGDKQTKVVLEKDKVLPKNAHGSPFVILEAGLFVLLYTDIGLSLRWDRGTRIYLTLDPRWRHKVTGLCGNFNDDQADDFQTPSGGMPDIQPLSFADSWKIRDSCPQALSASDACTIHPNRHTWASRKCSVLKSSLFEPCHSAVTLEPYYDRCISDSCACDEGGDCECLCTAIATYAHECNNQGVHIKWRTQELCPIQCEECSTYDSCMPSCPEKTCQNQHLYSSVEEVCSTDICVEGCNPKPCPPGEIFNNGKEYKCIPELECIVPCLEINGQMYNEGERITDHTVGDSCQSCHCLRGTVACTGKPCPTTTASPVINILPKCQMTGWTPWFNSPSSLGGDYEVLENPLIAKRLSDFCSTWNVTDIECRDADSKRSSKDIGQNVLCDLPIGLTCEDSKQEMSVCKDYEIRLFCSCGREEEEEMFTAPPLEPVTVVEECIDGWTSWMDVIVPESSGEMEKFGMLRQIYSFCSNDEIKTVECRSKHTWENSLLNNELNIECSIENGLRCKKAAEHLCDDYEIRFYCECKEEIPSCIPGWTKFYNIDNPEQNPEHGDEETIEEISKLYPLCPHGKIEDIECKRLLNDEVFDYKETGQFGLKCSKKVGFICNSFLQAKGQICLDYAVRFYCSCEAPPTTTTSLVTTTTTPFVTTTIPTTTLNPCPPGQTYDICAYNCSQVCASFLHHLSLETDICIHDSNGCIADCRPVDDCEPPLLWRDYENCVPIDECTCILNEQNEEPTIIAPNKILTRNCEKCQCIDNQLDCYDIPGCGVEPTTGWPWIFTTIPTTTTSFIPPITENPECWTEWINIDNPESGGGDFESLSFVRNHFDFCANPTKIECRTVKDHKTPLEIGQNLECDLKNGLNCWNADNGIDGCHNYEIRFYCPCFSTVPPTTKKPDCWTEWINIDNPDSGGGDFESISYIRNTIDFCKDPVRIECRTATDHKKPFEIGQNLECDVENGLHCWNADNGLEGCRDYEIRFYCPCEITTITVVTTTTIIPTMEPATCVDGWTEWFNSHQPNSHGESETIQSVRANGGYFCANDMISAIDCRNKHDMQGTPLQHGVVCDLLLGLQCFNADFDGSNSCLDYEVRFYCDCPTRTPPTLPPTTIPPPPPTTPLPTRIPCAYWSEWINERHPAKPSGVKSVKSVKSVKGGSEVEKQLLVRLQREKKFCLEGYLSAIECRDVKLDIDYTETGDSKLVCSLVGGFKCRGRDQRSGACRDYKIRYFCSCESTTPIILRPTITPTTIPPCTTYYQIVDGPFPLPDNSLKASTSIDPTAGPQNSRLSALNGFKSAGAWIASETDSQQFLEIDLGEVQPIYGVITKGRNGGNEWVKSYYVLYGRDGVSFSYVMEDAEFQKKKIFTGNFDSNTPVEHIFYRPFEARFIRIQPLTFRKAIALRADLLGCKKVELTTPRVITQPELTTVIVTTQTPPICMDKMGLENGSISDQQIHFSTVRDELSDASAVRLNVEQIDSHPGAWVSDVLDRNQFVEVDFLSPRNLSGVITQGRDIAAQWVTAFSVSYSDDGVIYSHIVHNGKPKIFPGNHDSDTPKTNLFPQLIRARYIRIHPLEWNNWIALRLEILGCYKPHEEILGPKITTVAPTIPAGVCVETMGFEDHLLSDSSIQVSSSDLPSSGASRIRLNTHANEEGTGGWVPSPSDYMPVVHITFPEERNLTGIITQGREDANMWIMSYRVEYSLNNKTWKYCSDYITNSVIFPGNHDRNTPEFRLFQEMVLARFVKITILDYHDLPAMRLELLGCNVQIEPTRVPPVSTEQCIEYGPWLSMSHSNHRFGDEEPIDKIIDFTGMCPDPLTIQCREIITKHDYSQTGQNVICDLEHGLLCKNSEQSSGYCMNYEVRIGCWSCKPPSTTPLPHLSICPEVPKILKENCPMSCHSNHSCDGSRCVPTVDCPCFKEGKRFNSGDIMLTSECLKCECMLNGYSKCKEMVCPPCRKSQWSEIGKSCKCECKECPFGTVLCATNGQCIDEERWCDGIVDCQDDEVECPTTPPTTTVTTTTMAPPPICTLTIPSETAVCEMNVNTFNTFDGKRYQYEICDHILTKEKSSEAFAVNVHKTCNESNIHQCKRYIVIHVDGLEIKMGPENGELYFNNYKVPLSNLGLLSRKYKDFVLRKRGNHLVFLSLKYNFEVSVDSKQDVKIKVSKCYVHQLAGLCGIYNGIMEDDFSQPNGVLSSGSTEFGDSWSIGVLNKCSPATCSHEILKKAVELCKEFYRDPFINCSAYLDLETRIDACITFICECSEESLDKEVLNSCKCKAYESFVDACEEKRNYPLTDWRIKFDCAPDCEHGLEYNECGPGCDLTCDNYHEIETVCEEKCVPGCYCPVGLVHHNGRCVKPKMCQDCVCRGHGDPNYISFDGHYYSFQGNCTYVLAQHQSGDENLDFQVLATNVECPEEPGTTCSDGIKVMWKGHVIEKFKGKPVIIDDVILKAEDSPYNSAGISVTFVPYKSTVMHIKEINLAVRYFDQMYGYNIELPAYLYFNRTEGLCGICNFDINDDIYHKDGFVTDDIEDFAYSWLVDNTREHCILPKVIVPTSEPYICNFTTNSCDMFIDPTLYSKSCQNDVSYSSNPDASMCRSKFQYAQQCCERGVALETWLKESGCLTSCPENMIFECTSACQKTCESIDESDIDVCDLMPLYTCTCPPDLVFKNGSCIDPIFCKTCDDKGHIIGDNWQIDSCESCECTEDLSVKCTVIECSQPPICLVGESLDVIPPDNETCCAIYHCKPPQRNHCHNSAMPMCEPGATVVLHKDKFNCPLYKCECNEELCPYVFMPISIEEGEDFQLERVGCCKEYRSVCITERCSLPRDCGLGFKQVVFPGKCCKKYNCVPEENVCIYRHKFDVGNGAQIVLAEEEYYDAKYEAGASWHDGLCRKCSCVEKNGQHASSCEIEICIDPSKYPDADSYVRESEFIPGACCPKYRRVQCISGGRKYSVGEEWPSPDGDKCKSFKCISGPHGEVIISQKSSICDKSCPAYAVYVEPEADSPKCCGYCKPVACEEDGIIHESGSRWKSISKACFTAECIVNENMTKIIYQGKSCPILPANCPKAHIVSDEEGCCPRCDMPTDTCDPAQIPSAETIDYFRLAHPIHGICKNTKPIVNLTKCAGQCESFTSFSTSFDNFESSCKCCLPSTADKRSITLNCEDGSRIKKLYQQPKACQCTSCGQGRGTIELPPPY